MGITGLLRGLNPLLVPPNQTAQQAAAASASSYSSSSSSTATAARRGSSGSPSSQKANTPSYHIRQFASRTLAIDASSWLHRAGYACAESLVESIETHTRSAHAERIYSNYVLTRCDALLHHANVAHIYLVFDGRRCPLKAVTNQDRERRRQSNLAEARRLKGLGRRKESGEKYKLCVKVTDKMARVVAEAVRRKYGTSHHHQHQQQQRQAQHQHQPQYQHQQQPHQPRVTCVFSPYEADAQLAKLCLDGYADAVVTEDSDVLVYSATCGVPFPIIYKLDRDSGSCDVISMDWLLKSDVGHVDAERREAASAAGDDPDGQEDGDENGQEDGLACVRRYLPRHGTPAHGNNNSNSQNAPDKGKQSRGRKGKSRSKAGGNGGSTSGAAGGNGNNALLTSLRSMSHRETRHPGAGTRTFVQACVLSGCDYAPSQLSGVGFVNAFRLIKENGHRDPAVRFDKVLRSLPPGKILPYGGDDGRDGGAGGEVGTASKQVEKKKSAADVERERLEEYETLLAKSEAVFYYHGVLSLSDGKVVPLVDPPPPSSSTMDAENDGDDDAEPESSESSTLSMSLSMSSSSVVLKSIDDAAAKDPRKYLPSADRFDGDLSFVGSLDLPPPVDGMIQQTATAPPAAAVSLTSSRSSQRPGSAAAAKGSAFFSPTGSSAGGKGRGQRGGGQRQSKPDSPSILSHFNQQSAQKKANDDCMDQIMGRTSAAADPASALAAEAGCTFNVSSRHARPTNGGGKPSSRERANPFATFAHDAADKKKENKSIVDLSMSDDDDNDLLNFDVGLSISKTRPVTLDLDVGTTNNRKGRAARVSDASELAPAGRDDDDDDDVAIVDGQDTSRKVQSTMTAETVDMSEEDEEIVLESDDATSSRGSSSRFFSQSFRKSRRISLESPPKAGGSDGQSEPKKSSQEQDDAMAETLKSNKEETTPAKKGSGPPPPDDNFWSDGDSNDCIIVESPMDKDDGKPRSSHASDPSRVQFPRDTFGSTHRRLSSGAPYTSQGKENASNSSLGRSNDQYYISAFQSGMKNRMSSSSSSAKKTKKSSKPGSRQRGGVGSSSALLAGFARQRERAAFEASDRSSTRTQQAARMSGSKRSSSSKLKGYFQPLSTKDRRS